MIVIDFLYYYFFLYFSNQRQNLSSPQGRTAYALGLMSTSWVMSALFFTLVYILKTKHFNGAYIFILVPVALVFIWLYNNIYVTNGRNRLIESYHKKLFAMNEGIGMLICCLALLFSFALPFMILLSDMK